MEKNHSLEQKLNIEMPVIYLLVLAIGGDMWTSKVSDFMRIWAERVCVANGYEKELKIIQLEKLVKHKVCLKTILGEELMKKLEDGTNEVSRALESIDIFEEKKEA